MARITAITPPIRIGVSSCLLGANVRFDGGNKRCEILADRLGKFVEFVPVCPEVEIGLGVPRETLRLVRDHGRTASRLIGNTTGTDYSGRMNRYAGRRLLALEGEELSGYVLKKNSPSCGVERVLVYGATGTATANGTGLFAAALMRCYPNLPIEEEGRLSEPHLRENFIQRVVAYQRLRSFFSSRWSRTGLLQFHTAHKLMLMAHSPTAFREIGRIFSYAKQMARKDLRRYYEAAFMQALKKLATRSRHTRVLRHLLGCMSLFLDRDVRDALVAVIDEYRGGLTPLTVPIVQFRHYGRKFDIGGVQGQLYLEPHPMELMLGSQADVGYRSR